VVTIVILQCFKKGIQDDGHYSQLDAVWRIQMGLALIPAFATLRPRLRMPEGKKYIESRELNTPSSASNVHHNVTNTVSDADIGTGSGAESTPVENLQSPNDPPPSVLPIAKTAPVQLDPKTVTHLKDLEKLNEQEDRKAKLNAFFIYFSGWRHLKTLIGTASCWFLLDVAFYGTNLNQSVLLADIGFSTGKTHWEALMKNAVGNLIIAVSGYVPGYFFTVALIEKLGRRWIQLQGFLMVALMFAILAGGYGKLGTAGKFVCFAIAQVILPILHQNKEAPIDLYGSSSLTSDPTR
jgi:PHS family inorganic phosphate transporter-like MFS transporter